MKLVAILICLFTLLLFSMGAFIGGTIAMRPAIEQARQTQRETNTLLAMSLSQLSHVQITPRLL